MISHSIATMEILLQTETGVCDGLVIRLCKSKWNYVNVCGERRKSKIRYICMYEVYVLRWKCNTVQSTVWCKCTRMSPLNEMLRVRIYYSTFWSHFSHRFLLHFIFPQLRVQVRLPVNDVQWSEAQRRRKVKRKGISEGRKECGRKEYMYVVCM